MDAPDKPDKPPHAGGRSSKYTPAIAKAICDSVESGTPKKYAAQAAGISESTLYAWCAGDPEFSELVKRAEGIAVEANIKVIKTATPKNWTAAAWWLERRHPRDFGRKDNLTLSNDDMGKTAMEVVNAILDAIHKDIPDTCGHCSKPLDLKTKLGKALMGIIEKFKPDGPSGS